LSGKAAAFDTDATTSNSRIDFFNLKIWLIMGLAWQAYGLGHLAKSVHGYYLVYRNFDNEMKTNRWFAKYETGSDRFGEQVSRIEFQGFDSLEDAQAFCEKNALDVERALHGCTRPPEIPS
jgi:hypothetical protein